MLCPDCQTKNPDGSKFCLNCSKRIGLYCIGCKANLPAEALFCNECGRTVSPVEPSLVTKIPIDEKLALLARGQPIDLGDILADFESALIGIVMELTGGNKSRSAILLGISRPTLIQKLQRHQDRDQD